MNIKKRILQMKRNIEEIIEKYEIVQEKINSNIFNEIVHSGIKMAKTSGLDPKILKNGAKEISSISSKNMTPNINVISNIMDSVTSFIPATKQKRLNQIKVNPAASQLGGDQKSSGIVLWLKGVFNKLFGISSKKGRLLTEDKTTIAENTFEKKVSKLLEKLQIDENQPIIFFLIVSVLCTVMSIYVYFTAFNEEGNVIKGIQQWLSSIWSNIKKALKAIANITIDLVTFHWINAYKKFVNLIFIEPTRMFLKLFPISTKTSEDRLTVAFGWAFVAGVSFYYSIKLNSIGINILNKPTT